MKVFRGSLFIGGNSVREISSILCAINWRCGSAIVANGGAELFRVNADNTWDVVVGAARTTPDKPTLSGIGPGFNWPLNQHLWRMEVYNDRLYVGTYDVSTELRNAPGISAALAPYLGFDLWQTSDGIHFNPADITGFGDRFDYGVRALLATPAGLFLGSANPFYGLRVYRAPTAE
jgi:hypothetical protein